MVIKMLDNDELKNYAKNINNHSWLTNEYISDKINESCNILENFIKNHNEESSEAINALNNIRLYNHVRDIRATNILNKMQSWFANRFNGESKA